MYQEISTLPRYAGSGARRSTVMLKAAALFKGVLYDFFCGKNELLSFKIFLVAIKCSRNSACARVSYRHVSFKMHICITHVLKQFFYTMK